MTPRAVLQPRHVRAGGTYGYTYNAAGRMSRSSGSTASCRLRTNMTPWAARRSAPSPLPPPSPSIGVRLRRPPHRRIQRDLRRPHPRIRLERVGAGRGDRRRCGLLHPRRSHRPPGLRHQRDRSQNLDRHLHPLRRRPRLHQAPPPPGQWFQSESGLHQNWMRDYDPTTGRYLQADPLGLMDGASVYGYVGQNPGRWIDPLGLWTVGPRSGALPDYNPYTDDLVQCDGDDCYDLWQKDQDACFSKLAAHTIADLPACLRRASDIYNHCMSGSGGPPPAPWAAR